MIPFERPFADLRLVTCPHPGRHHSQSELLMARLRPGGILELLSAPAWARALGYLPEELSGRYLRELIPLEKGAASAVVADLADSKADGPLDVPLRCKDQRHKYFRFYRRFDDRAETIFVIADELPLAERLTPCVRGRTEPVPANS